MSWTGRALWMLSWLLAALLLAACDQASPTPTPRLHATPTVTAEPQQPAVTPASPLRTQPTGTTLAATTPPEPAATPLVPEAADGLLPEILSRLPLAPAGAQLYDLLLDVASGLLYVTDTTGRLHILDAGTYEEKANLPANGELVLDPGRGRLYVSQGYDEGELTIVDTETLSVVGAISPGGFVALDNRQERFYVGNPVQGPQQDSGVGIRVYDAETLLKVGEVSQPGIPVYNPLRDELYAVGYTAHIVDPDTLQVIGDLLPEVTVQSPPWCNGCLAATSAQVYPDRNLLVVDVTTLSAGKGPGKEPPPRFFNGTTLREITEPTEIPPVERGCHERLILAKPVGDHVYREERYSRYVFHNNLLVYDLDGSPTTWRDGLSLGITNPSTSQAYVPHGDDTLVLDLAQLAPAGTLPPMCIHSLDAEAGRIYALADRDLVVLSERGGQFEPDSTGKPGPLPEDQIASIQPSPDYAQDQTIFLTTGSGAAYRSTDRGETWARLRGGLPGGDYLSLDLAISPDFASDQTLFAGGFRLEFWGEGVYRSTDRGDTWQPMWKDLTHLRVYDVVLSPDYGRDGTLLAYSKYQRITPWKGGVSVSRSTDGGMGWALVMTGTQASDLPPAEAFLPPGRTPPAIQFREAGYGQGLERSIDGARTWEPVPITRQPEFHVQSIVKSPNFGVDHTLYVLAEFDLFRSIDGGENWERWDDERLYGRDYHDKLATATVSPVLPDGQHQLFVGSAAGEFWSLDPGILPWEPVHIAEQWPTELEGEWVGEIEVAPNGDVWLGTWGGGLALYVPGLDVPAGGVIEARHTVTDGLPTQYVGALTVTPEGKVWAGGDLPPGIASLEGDTWTPHPLPGEDGVGAVYDLSEGPDGAIWAGAQAPGLLRWTGLAWELISDPDGLTGWRINDIKVDDAGTVWAATVRGLVFYGSEGWSGGGSQEATAVEFGPRATAYLLLSDASVWRLAESQWQQLPQLQDGKVLRGLSLHIAEDGAVWVGTHAGAFRFDGNAWRQFTAQDGLPSNEVVAITQDAAGWLWFGTGNGAARVEPATLALEPVSGQALVSPTPVPRAQPTPASCAVVPTEPFIMAHKETEVANRLGCAIAGAASSQAAYQPFEYGLMFWQGDEGVVFVLEADGTWARYADTWDSTQPPSDPALTVPQGLLQPVRGFGKVWRERLGGPDARLGWALSGEQAFDMQVQSFTGGQMFVGPWGEVYILYADGSWESRE